MEHELTLAVIVLSFFSGMMMGITWKNYQKFKNQKDRGIGRWDYK